MSKRECLPGFVCKLTMHASRMESLERLVLHAAPCTRAALTRVCTRSTPRMVVLCASARPTCASSCLPSGLKLMLT